MFDKYIELSKEKSFFQSFIMMIVISCVAYSYNFQYLLMWDDLPASNGLAWGTLIGDSSDIIHASPRAFGYIISMLLSDGAMGKNAMVFLSLLANSWFVVFFVRRGFGVQSVFWVLVLSTLIVLNSAMAQHYNWVRSVIDLRPAFYGLVLFAAAVVSPNKKDILLTSILVFLSAYVYEPTILQYIIAVMSLVIIEIFKHQKLPIGELFKTLWRNRIMPSILALLGGGVIYTLTLKLLLTKYTDQLFQSASFNQKMFVDVLHNLRVLLDQSMYQLYVTTLENTRLVILGLMLSALISTIMILRNQGWKKSIILTLTLMMLFFAMPFIIQLRELYVSTSLLALRTVVPYGIVLALLFHIASLTFAKLKYTKYIAIFFAFAFALQIVNSTISRALTIYKGEIARRATMNRLFIDISKFARKHKIINTITIKPLYNLSNGNQTLLTRRFYLHFTDTTDSYYTFFSWMVAYTYAVGAHNDYRFHIDTKKNKKSCMEVMNDKTMHRWPFYNSMKLIDGVIYIKMEEQSASLVCNSYQPDNVAHAQRLKDGTMEFGTYNKSQFAK